MKHVNRGSGFCPRVTQTGDCGCDTLCCGDTPTQTRFFSIAQGSQAHIACDGHTCDCSYRLCEAAWESCQVAAWSGTLPGRIAGGKSVKVIDGAFRVPDLPAAMLECFKFVAAMLCDAQVIDAERFIMVFFYEAMGFTCSGTSGSYFS